MAERRSRQRGRGLPATFAIETMDDARRLEQALGLTWRDARAEAELLLTRALGIGKAHLAAHPELAAEARRNARYLEYLERRLAGEPVAYILGEREFYGLAFHVTPDVLIPRPETELLVELALARIPEGEPRRVLDIGTGSGCIAVTLAHLRPRARVIATDVSAAALASGAVSTPAGMRVGQCRASSWRRLRAGAGRAVRRDRLQPAVCGRERSALLLGDLRFEPKHALTSGADGLA